MTSIKVLGPDTSVESVVKYLNEDACVIVRELMGEDALGSLTREFEAPHPNLRSTGTPFAGFKTNRMHGILKTLPTTQRLALHPLILGVADQVLLPHAARYQLNYDGVMQLLPGESPQALHRDAFIYPIRPADDSFSIGDHVGLHGVHGTERRYLYRARQPPLGRGTRTDGGRNPLLGHAGRFGGDLHGRGLSRRRR